MKRAGNCSGSRWSVRRHELPEDQRVFPHDGARLNEIGVEVSEHLHIIPQQVRVIRHERVKYACPCCDGGLRVAAKPPQATWRIWPLTLSDTDIWSAFEETGRTRADGTPRICATALCRANWDNGHTNQLKRPFVRRFGGSAQLKRNGEFQAEGR